MGGAVCLRSYFDPEEAYVVRGALQASGIYVILFNDPILTSLPHLRVATGGYRLCVPSSQEAAAREALLEIESHQTDEPIGADNLCPKCGSRHFRRERSWRWAVIAFFLGTGLTAQSRRSRCFSCGEAFDNDHRPVIVRLFFLLASAAILAWIAWGWSLHLYYLLAD